MIKIHLDTDIGGDIDDLCALAFVLSHPDVQLVGVTTVADENGRRAGYARYALGLAGASSVPVAAGADVSLGRFRFRPGYPPHERYWPEPVPAAPGPRDAARDLLQSAIREHAVVVGIGPFTNLALHEAGATLHQREAPRGRETRVVTRVDGAAFGDRWCATLVEAAGRRAAGERGPGQRAP